MSTQEKHELSLLFSLDKMLPRGSLTFLPPIKH